MNYGSRMRDCGFVVGCGEGYQNPNTGCSTPRAWSAPRGRQGQLEAAIIQQRDGRWAAFEAKLGQSALDEAAKNLLTLADRIDTATHGGPAVLAVITGWGAATRHDGVWVIPIGALCP